MDPLKIAKNLFLFLTAGFSIIRLRIYYGIKDRPDRASPSTSSRPDHADFNQAIR